MLFNKIPIGIAMQDLSFNQDVKAIEVNENINNLYMLQWFISQEDKILGMVTGTGIGAGKLDLPELKALEFPLPSLAEQQKIADFLAAVDARIGALQQQKALLQQYKQGVMQRIFAQEIRFTDEHGQPFPDWEVKTLGEVYSFYSTNSLSREKLNYDTGQIRNIHYGDIHTKFSNMFYLKNEKVPFINEDVPVKKIAETSYCHEGDLVIADASEDYADIGKTIELIDLNGEKIVAGLHTFLARPVAGVMATGFAGYMMKSANVRLQIMTIAQGTKVLSISTGRLGAIHIPVPSVAEQAKIAGFLSALDGRIASCDTQLAETQRWKAGLLQGVFV
jgi:type I restriction enzyme S subunit